MESQETQSTPSPQSPQPQPCPEHADYPQNDMIFVNHPNPTPSILSLNGLLQNATNTQKTAAIIKSEAANDKNNADNNNHDSNNDANANNDANNNSNNNNGLLPPQFSGFPSYHHHYQQPGAIITRYPPPQPPPYSGAPPHFPPPPNNENKQCLMQYQPVMAFPAMIPLNNNQGIPLNIHHPPPLITNTPNNVINEDDIFGTKYSPITTRHTKQIMIINPSLMSSANAKAKNTQTKRRKRRRGKKRKRSDDDDDDDDSNDSNDSNDSDDSNESNVDDDDGDDDDDEHSCDEDNDFEGICNLRTRPISKKRRIENVNTNSSSNINGRHYCRYCSKSFVQNCHLSRHIREKHASSKPSFECRICSKSFNQRSNLKVHLRSHALDESVSRPWLCTECYPNRRFTRKSSLKRHWVKKHKTISAQLISELDLRISDESNSAKTHAIVKNEHIKNEPFESLRYEHGIYRIGDIEIPPEVFQPATQHQHNHNLPPLLGE